MVTRPCFVVLNTNLKRLMRNTINYLQTCFLVSNARLKRLGLNIINHWVSILGMRVYIPGTNQSPILRQHKWWQYLSDCFSCVFFSKQGCKWLIVFLISLFYRVFNTTKRSCSFSHFMLSLFPSQSPILRQHTYF
jgi:hypothetical protein